MVAATVLATVGTRNIGHCRACAIRSIRAWRLPGGYTVRSLPLPQQTGYAEAAYLYLQ